MPTKKLTDLFVERAKPPASGRVEYFDASFPGLALRVTDKGAKSWSVFYRFGGRLRRLTLGSWPAIKPAKAREEAQTALDRVREGVDPAEDKRARRELRTPETDTFGAVADDFLERHVRRNNRESTFLEAKRDLERDALRKWRTRPIASITRRDVIDLIDGIIERGAPVQATFLSDNEELRGILNSGHRRSGAVLRTVGDEHEPRQFATYAAVAIALIGNLPGTLADRSVTVMMRRRRQGELVEPFRFGRTDHLAEIARKAARWAEDNADRARNVDPVMPDGAYNRVADNWRPLLTIADLAGGEWPQRAREAFAAMQAETDEDSRGALLLSDVRDILTAREVDRIASADLLAALVEIEARPWSEFGRSGKPMTANALARMLKGFGIGTTQARIGSKNLHCYLRSSFDDAFARYLPAQPLHRYKCDEMGTSELFQSATLEPPVADRKCEKSNNYGICSDVAVVKGDSLENVCDHCGNPSRDTDPVRPWDKDGGTVLLHSRCEAEWYDTQSQTPDRESAGGSSCTHTMRRPGTPP
jgi:hypothetical protein